MSLIRVSLPTITGSLLNPVLDFVYPPLCLGCEREERPGPLALGLCLACRGRLKVLRGRHCTGCAQPLAAASPPAGYLCGRCRQDPPAFERLLALWSYEPPLVKVIHGLKFGRLDWLGDHLARELWHRLGGELRRTEAVVAVPLHWRRRMTRGYNQAERIARPLARRLQRPLVAALRRIVATPPQARLERSQRGANLKGAFRGRRAAAMICGCRVLLVDDVATTGATLDAAAAALRRCGAASVLALAVARTPPPGAELDRRQPRDPLDCRDGVQ